MTTNAVLSKDILNAVTLLQARQGALDAIQRKVVLWAPRVDDEVKKEFYRAIDMFIVGANGAARDGRMDMMEMLHPHILSYRPNTTKAELDAFMKELDLFDKHIQEAIKKSHPYQQKEFERISQPFKAAAAAFLLTIIPCKVFKDRQILQQLQNEWNNLAAAWKKELDEKLPLPNADSEEIAMAISENRTPEDWSNPEWDKVDKIHNWRNHISEEIQVMWHTFTDEQKQAIARQAEGHAGRENWE